MAFRPEIKPYAAIASVSMAASITGTPTIIQKLSMVSYQFVWTGTSPVGTVGVQVSNDYALDATGAVLVAGTWSTYYFLISGGTYATTISVSGNAGNAIIELPNVCFYAVRPIYTRVSGTGTLIATINGKVS